MGSWPLLSRTGGERYRKLILLKLYEHGYWGGRHTSEENIVKGFPPGDYKQIEKTFHSLKRQGFFILTPKPDGLHVSLNPRMRISVEATIKSAQH